MFSIPLTNWNSHRGSPEWLCQKIISSTGTFCSSSLGRHTLIRGSSSQPLNAPVAVRDWAWLLHAPTGRCFLDGSHTRSRTAPSHIAPPAFFSARLSFLKQVRALRFCTESPLLHFLESGKSLFSKGGRRHTHDTPDDAPAEPHMLLGPGSHHCVAVRVDGRSQIVFGAGR